MNHESWSTGLIVHDQIILEQANTYKTVEAAFKELPLNSWDADSLECRLTITPHEVVAEDWGIGMSTKEEIENFWRLGSPHKKIMNETPVYKRPVIGYKGVGVKGAGAKIGKNVEVISRKASTFKKSNDFIIVSDMKYDLNENDIVSNLKFDHNRYEAKYPNTVLLEHPGTKIKIRDLRTKVDAKKTMEYLGRRMYGLTTPLISRYPIKISINDQPVVSNPPMAPAGVTPKKVNMFCISKDKAGGEKNYGEIRGYLWPSQSPSIDVLVKAPVVTTATLISPTHPVSGYVMADFLNITTNREEINDDEIYGTFVNQLTSYIAGRFPSRIDYILKREVNSMKTLTKLMDLLLEEDKFVPQISQQSDSMLAQLPQGLVTPTQPLLVQPTEGGSVTTPGDGPLGLERSRFGSNGQEKGKEKPVTHVRSKYGIEYLTGNYGTNNPSIIVTYGRTTIISLNKNKQYVKKCFESEGRLRNIMLAHLYAGAYGLFKDRLQSVGFVKDISGYNNFVEVVATRLLSKMSGNEES